MIFLQVENLIMIIFLMIWFTFSILLFLNSLCSALAKNIHDSKSLSLMYLNALQFSSSLISKKNLHGFAKPRRLSVLFILITNDMSVFIYPYCHNILLQVFWRFILENLSMLLIDRQSASFHIHKLSSSVAFQGSTRW